MTLEVEQQAQATLVRVSGDLTHEGSEEFVALVADLLQPRGARVAVDLSAVPFVNSEGLGALVTVTGRSNVRESMVVFFSLSPFVAGVVQTTRLDKYLTIAADLNAALQHLNPTESR